MSDDPKRGDASADSGAYVLNALVPDERAAFEARLENSDELRNEVTESTDTAVLLGMAVAPVQPSDELKSSIMEKIATMPQLPKDVPPVRELHPSGVAQPVGEANRKAQLRWYNRPVIAITSAAAAVALLIGGGVAGGGGEPGRPAFAAGGCPCRDQLGTRRAACRGIRLDRWQGHAGLVAFAPQVGAHRHGSWCAPQRRELRDVVHRRQGYGDTVGVTIEPAGGSKAPTTKPIVAIAST